MGSPVAAVSLGEALEALRRPLTFAARDNFAAIDRVVDLGPTLAQACARLLPHVRGERGAQLAAWARDLGEFAARPRAAREQLVARGMRLVATCALDAPAVTAPSTAGSNPARLPAPAAAAAADGAIDWTAPAGALAGVGPRVAERLLARGLRTVGDLAHFIPRRWDDLRTLTPVGALQPGQPQITRATVAAARVVFGRRRFLEVSFVGDDGAKLKALWFYFRGGMRDRFKPGSRFLLAGVPKPYKDALQMAHPETTLLDDDDAGGAGAIRARYPEVEGVHPRLVERLCRAAVEKVADALPDGVPAAVRARRGLPSQGEALRALHVVGEAAVQPSADEVAALNRAATPAHRRLAFDELFFLQLGLARRRANVARDEAVACPRDDAALARFFAALPFRPTAAQRRAVDEIAADLARPHPMQRLLQGDVGSGKTVVLFAAATQAMAAGLQVAVMAPTELLADQHARTLSAWAKATGRRTALLTASTPRGARESILQLLAAGKLDLVIGTHALLAESVGFARLGLVVIDEQHRFGVAQRATLRDKASACAPHLLVMTATPIPRTLALTAYGDLDLTLLDELPPGREPAETRLLAGARARADGYRRIRRALDAGRQAYVVCPLVEQSDKLDVADAVATHERLRMEFAPHAVGLVHGRLPAGERDEVMERFRSGAVRLLVATTVVEVGVDVPAAEAMLIEGAERFGLAQLHQLRGRIGRGAGGPPKDGEAEGRRGKPLCLLATDEGRSAEATRRLEVMVRSSDGFTIADEDLKLRGPGELYGTRQAGMPRLRYADLARDLELLRDARADAFALLRDDPELARPEHAATRAVLDARWRDGSLFGEEAG